jgi:hypothetical protein
VTDLSGAQIDNPYHSVGIHSEHNYYDCKFKTNTISIGYVNVCGLKSKFLSPDFEDYVREHDIVCVCETKLSSDELIEVEGYSFFQKSRKGAKRSSGGVAIFIKEELCKYFKVVDTDSDFTLWVKCDRELTGYPHDMLYCIVYVPPENSHYSSLGMFDILEEEYLSIHTNESVCVIGDFNSRTKDLTDLIGMDPDLLESLDLADYVKAKLEEEKMLEELGFDLKRVSQDPVSNNYGYRLLEMCKNIGICIINGRVGSDRGVGNTTCDGKSMVDYIMISPELFPLVQDFKVEPFDCNYSDKHNPLCMALKLVDPSLLNTLLESSKNEDNRPAKRKVHWADEKRDMFNTSLSAKNVENILLQISELDSNNAVQENIDSVVEAIDQMFSDSAEKVGISKKVKTKSTKRQSISMSWFNKQCEDKRKLYLKARNLYANTKLQADKDEMKRLNKEYKKCLQSSKRQYKTDLNNKLRNLRTSNPKKYWDLVNMKTKPDNIPIESEVLYEHFRNLSHAEIDGTFEKQVFDQGCIEYNHDLNSPFTPEEIKKCINKLKNNKAHGIDLILNEYLKCSSDIMLPIYEKLFNIILTTGLIPKTWLSGMIKPIYKNKGDKENVNNYRGITLLSCLGKLFTAVINERLSAYLLHGGVIGEEQAGFRKGYSTMDHVFTLQSLLELYLSKKKRLYCCFVDYKKAFDLVDRVILWRKLISCDINGKMFRVIFNLYKGAKSCVSGKNNVLSNFFSCLIGVRQGENLSPLLFAIFLNDLERFMASRYGGLKYFKEKTSELLSDDDVEVFLNLFILLYADDTIILSESQTELQNALNGMMDYCVENKLQVNVEKTKVVIFSRGKIRNVPIFKYGDDIVDCVTEYKYLGIIFAYNGSSTLNVKSLANIANKAMFALIQKGRDLFDIDTMLHLFDTMITPILLYGSEVWGFKNIDIIERIHLRFCKILLKLHKSTPNVMVYGELGRHPLDINVKVRMVTFWHKLCTVSDKICSIMYNLLHKMHVSNENVSNWLTFVKGILNNLGLSHVWDSQCQDVSLNWLKLAVKMKLTDQFQQKWESDVFDSSKCCNYRMFKVNFGLENYLTQLSPKIRVAYTKFRCRNTKLPIVSGIYNNIPKEDRVCTLCNSNDKGDEFHYIFECVELKNEREVLLKSYFWHHPSTFKMNMLFNSSGRQLVKLCKFIRHIVNNTTATQVSV